MTRNDIRKCVLAKNARLRTLMRDVYRFLIHELCRDGSGAESIRVH